MSPILNSVETYMQLTLDTFTFWGVYLQSFIIPTRGGTHYSLCWEHKVG